jgi:hypothetical protein
MAPDLAQQRTTSPAPPPGLRLLDRAVIYVQRLLCGLHGHDALLHFEQGRLSLVCASCGHQTPGWDLTALPPRTDPAATPRRVVRLPLVGERRVA